MRQSRYQLAEKWEKELFGNRMHPARESHQLALSLSATMKKHGVCSVLDVGCGDGLAIRAFNLHGFSVAGTEISQEAIKALMPLTVYPCPIHEMSNTFTDGEFDFVLSVDVLDHVGNIDAITGAKEIVRIARMGFAVVVNGMKDDKQTILESPDFWFRIFKDILGEDGKIDLLYGRRGTAMLIAWKGED